MPLQIARIGRSRCPRLSNQRDFELIAFGRHDLHGGMFFLPVSRRRDIVATGQHQAVDPIQGIGDAHVRVDDADFASGVQNRLLVVFELA